jgi:muramoyltetrapeptide carboxypeptidase
MRLNYSVLRSPHKIIKPRALCPNDTIGIVAPSSQVVRFPNRTERGIQQLRDLGFRIEVSATLSAMWGNSAGSARLRAEDFNRFVHAPHIAAIMFASGGLSATSVVPLIDFDALRRHPKIVCGYSDASAILLAVTSLSDVVTFYGPMLLPTFGEVGGACDFSVRSFLSVVSDPTSRCRLAKPSVTTSEYLRWEFRDTRSRVMRRATSWVTLNGGVAEGPSIVANLDTLCRMVGTPYFPDCDGAVLFLEWDAGTPDALENMLQQLVQARVLDRVAGLVFGRGCRFRRCRDRSMHSVLRDVIADFEVPVLADVDFGHSEPRLTLPIGIAVQVDATSREIHLEERAVLDVVE